MRRELLLRRATAVLVLTAAAAALVGCGSPSDADRGERDGDRPEDRGEPASEEATQTADLVCSMLRGWNNDLGDVINTAAQTITDEDDPGTADGVLLQAFDDMIALAETHLEAVGALQLPEIDERQELLDELTAGAEESLSVLEEERGNAADLGPIDVDGQRGALGTAFTGVERATSVFEPEIGAYSPDLRTAFEDDSGCIHVIQPY
jgi:hypothetical protein